MRVVLLFQLFTWTNSKLLWIRETHSPMFWLAFSGHTVTSLDSSYISFSPLFATGSLP